MAHEVTGEIREISVTAKLTGEDVPVISTEGGIKFTPNRVVAIWVRENADSWQFGGVELSGVLPVSKRHVFRVLRTMATVETYEWLRELMRDITPSELHETSTS